MRLQNRKSSSDRMNQSSNDYYDEVLSFSDEKQEHKWSVSWSDLMMTMFILFVVMYVYQVGDKELKFGPGPGRNSLSDQGSGTVINTNLRGKPLSR